MYEKVEFEAAISLEHIGRIFKMVSSIPCFQEKKSRISQIEVLPGGLTNSNYKVTIDEVTYALRLAGEGTMEYLNRPAEKHNAQIMADIAVNAPIIYYDETTGNQVCKYIDDCLTLHQEHFNDNHYIQLAAKVFRNYHTCGKEFISEFNPLRETRAYRNLLTQKNYGFYEGSELMSQKLDEIEALLEKYPAQSVPCHNDPLCENWLDDQKNFYLIDWEYGGMNDPMFDLGALSIEANLNDEQERYLLRKYFGGDLTEKQWGSLIINKFLCDALWSYWAVLQIATGKSYEDYWPYGLNRYKRAYKLIHEGTLDRALQAFGS
ncbi:MAG TPA: choline kinase family protein [Negativicutes bacterium]|jgi:thiamine kinase-like enzyme